MDLKLIKEYKEELEQIHKNGNYKEFEVALLLYECSSDLSEEQITNELVDIIYSLSSNRDNLIDSDLAEDIDTALELAENITEEEEENGYDR